MMTGIVRNIMAAATAITLAVCVAPVMWAQQQPPRPDTSTQDPHAVQPERPTVATHAGTVARGWAEIETGVERDGNLGRGQYYTTPTVLKIGLASRVQLDLMDSYIHVAPGRAGLGDASIALKWRLVDDAPLLGDFAIQPSLKFPTGDRGKSTGTGTTDASILLISSHEFSGIAMDLNVLYSRTSEDESFALWTASFGGPFVGKAGWVFEVFGTPGLATSSTSVAVLAGPTYLVHPWLALDAGFIHHFNNHLPTALYAGLVYNIGNLMAPDPRQPNR